MEDWIKFKIFVQKIEKSTAEELIIILYFNCIFYMKNRKWWIIISIKIK